MDIQAKLAVAEIETKAQNISERLAFVEEFMKQQHAQAHDAGMQAQDHASPPSRARSYPSRSSDYLCLRRGWITSEMATTFASSVTGMVRTMCITS